MEIQEIKDKVNKAVDKLLVKDKSILDININERAISHRLAVYLGEEFPEWDVDCEYNRNHDDVKKLQLFPKNISSDELEATSVYPDIIIHKRNTHHNLFVLEMKKSTSSIDSHFDIQKIYAFRRELGYKLGLFLIIPMSNSGETEFQWY